MTTSTVHLIARRKAAERRQMDSLGREAGKQVVSPGGAADSRRRREPQPFYRNLLLLLWNSFQ